MMGKYDDRCPKQIVGIDSADDERVGQRSLFDPTPTPSP
jgi:hypothetical protein